MALQQSASWSLWRDVQETGGKKILLLACRARRAASLNGCRHFGACCTGNQSILRDKLHSHVTLSSVHWQSSWWSLWRFVVECFLVLASYSCSLFSRWQMSRNWPRNDPRSWRKLNRPERKFHAMLKLFKREWTSCLPTTANWRRPERGFKMRCALLIAVFKWLSKGLTQIAEKPLFSQWKAIAIAVAPWSTIFPALWTNCKQFLEFWLVHRAFFTPVVIGRNSYWGSGFSTVI